jgi:membrane-associated phospholipid phosphatase
MGYTIWDMTDDIQTEPKATVPKYKIKLVIAALIAFWTPVIIFSKLAGEIVEKEHIGIDRSILLWLHSHANSFYDHLFLFFTTLGNAEVLGPITILIVAGLLIRKQRLKAFIVFFGVFGAAAANLILKALFHRDRPALWQSAVHEASYSFPSGHAMLSCALIVSIILITWHTRARWVAVAAGVATIILIGISRLYLGVHYPTDIIAGWSAGLAWVVIVHIIANGLAYKRRTKA